MATVIVVNILVITLVVLIHYEFLYRVTDLLPRLKVRHRFRIVFIVLIALTAHAAEVWVFGIAFFLMNQAGDWGYLQGNFSGGLSSLMVGGFSPLISIVRTACWRSKSIARTRWLLVSATNSVSLAILNPAGSLNRAGPSVSPGRPSPDIVVIVRRFT